jgi:hypothetical protein
MGLLGVDVKGAGEAVGAVATGIGSLAIAIRTAITGKTPIDENKAADIALQLEQLASQAQAAKDNINAIEAANPRILVSGWRPALGWVLDAAVALYLLPKFAGAAVVWILHSLHSAEILPYPDVGWEDVVQLLVGLGITVGARAIEKVKGVAAT